jgi:transposase InsO family protein
LAQFSLVFLLSASNLNKSFPNSGLTQNPKTGASCRHSLERREGLNVEVFFSLANARRKLAVWLHDYNHHRPHSALADRTPNEFAALCSGGWQWSDLRSGLNALA